MSNVSRPSRKKIAILGGGLGALAAAYELTNRPRWWEDYEITIHQKGWRLGGKGASGRGENGRIEEHGLHCFWGFYDNAFGMLRTCYGEIDRQTGPIRTIADAFHKLSAVYFIDRLPDATGKEQWRYYEMHFPETSAEPGTGERLTEMSTVELIRRYVRQVREVLAEHAEARQPFESVLDGAFDLILDRLEDAWTYFASDEQAVDRVESHGMLEKLTGAAAPFLASIPEALNGTIDSDAEYRRHILFQAAKFAFVMLRGIVSDGIPTTLEQFDAYDRWDLREWLARHGASDDLLASPVVRGLYNASFCYPEGDFSRPNLAAGVSLRTILLMGFTYKGSFMWKMQASMGDIVFAPLYEALLRRGEEADRLGGVPNSLRIEFFHKATKLGLDAQKRAIDTIEIDVQARAKTGRYEPLVDIKELPCWPAKPLYDQLENGDALRPFDLESDWISAPPVERRVLRRGKDFDFVVCGIPVGALAEICRDLVAAEPAWKAMVENVKTIRTKSFQIWLRRTDDQQSWMNARHIMTDVYQDDYNSCADMFQTLPFESWRSGEEPGGVMYFSTAMADDVNEPHGPNDGYQAAQDEVIFEESRAWLKKWQEGLFGWLGTTWDPDAFVDQFSRANVNKDQRYTLSVKGSTQYRLAPDGSHFENLYLAGDWTKSPLNLGCAENATMSGLLAARGLVHANFERPLRAGTGTFVDYLGMPVYPPAYRQKDITLCQFLLKADPKKLQEVLDRYLNVGQSEHRFHALGKWVILQTGHIADNSSEPPADVFGSGKETSATFLIPTGRWRGKRESGVLPVEVGMFAPMIFVDHPLSLIAGREVIGMAKHLATFTGTIPRDLDHVTIKTMGLRELRRTTPVELLDLLHIERTDATHAPASSSLRRLVDRAIDAVVPNVADAALRKLLEMLLSEKQVRFYSLRQMRDIRDPRRTVLQEVTRARMTLGAVQLQPMAKRHTIRIAPVPSHPIASKLGLPDGPLTPVAKLKVKIAEATLDIEP